MLSSLYYSVFKLLYITFWCLLLVEVALGRPEGRGKHGPGHDHPAKPGKQGPSLPVGPGKPGPGGPRGPKNPGPGLPAGPGGGPLAPNFYDKSCPNFGSVITRVVNSAISSDPRMGASLLRLHFHDCFVNGCDASLLLDDTPTFTGEKSATPKNSLRGFDVIDSIKSQLEKECPGVVSCADILALAARQSVLNLGGPSWDLRLGRRDSTTASLNDALASLPSSFADLSGLISNFANKGFSAKEMVALSGAHTIGKARCTFYRTRIYNETNINSAFAASLRSICPTTGGDDNLSPFDSTSAKFDGAYFTGLMNQKGLLHSDQALFNGGSSDPQVRSYSSDPSAFFRDFSNAMAKMANLSPLTGQNGQVRTNCRRIN